jgi:predicted Zn finger-like uncharacterized protein
MVIECKRCLKRFILDESLLRLEGAKVKCTKCGNIFPPFPPSAARQKSSPGKNAMINPAAAENCNRTPAVQKRQHPRIGISVPVSCISEDSEGKPLNLYRGHVINASQRGVTVELSCSSISGPVLLSFTNHEGETIQLKGRVVNSVKEESGKLRLGVSLLGSSQSICRFVANLVRAHHFKNKAKFAGSVAPAARGIVNPC